MSIIKKLFYRVFQFLLVGVGMTFMPQPSPKLLTGAGSIKKLPAFIKERGIGKVLIVTDKVLSKMGLLESLFEACDRDGLSYVLYDEAIVNPSIECIEKAYEMYREHDCQAFIAFGGGSAMDCAKAAAARVARPKKSISQLGGTLKVRSFKVPPLFAVPTTAGTGSEATLAAVVTDYSTQHKYAIQDPSLLPRYAVLDPELTVGLPPHTTATTGLDALTHAIEAYTNKFAPRYTRRLSEKATKLIFENLPKVYRDGKDLEARADMQLAALYAGRAFSRACVGYVHAIAHTLGGLYGTPHGLANAVILPYVIEDFGSAVHKKLARLADVVGINGRNDEEKAKAFIAAIKQMESDMGIPKKIDVIKDEDIPKMVRFAMKEGNPLYPVPVIWGREEFVRTIERIRSKDSKRAYFISEKCIGCTLCARNCPVFAIEGKPKERHIINPKRCIECGVCANMCNVGAILDADGKVAEKKPKQAWKKPVIDEELCSACSICVQACGKNCLRISPPKYKGDIKVHAYLENEKQCVGCGLCALRCPLNAITMKDGEQQA